MQWHISVVLSVILFTEGKVIEYEELLNLAEQSQVDVIEDYPFGSPNLKGLYCDNTIALSRSLRTSAEKACILAEELGHYHTSSGNILDQNDTVNRKQEHRARMWAYDRQIGLIGIVKAYSRGCHTRHDAADYLGVTEEFFQDALDFYRSRYGTCAELDHYLVFFEPFLAVMEKCPED